jgi:predicted GH43/DUF377 family glycosyl hydrolase
MSLEAMMRHADLMLKPDPSRTVIRPFLPGDPPAFAVPDRPRARRIAERVLAYDEATVHAALDPMFAALNDRFREPRAVLLRRFDEIAPMLDGADRICELRRLLIGAYLSEEYAFEAAALFNPSVVLHPDQSELAPGEVRFVMSLRAIGEGHVSSVTFRTGVWSPSTGRIVVDRPSPTAIAAVVERPNEDDARVLLHCGGSLTVSETVLFPVLPSQHQGIEDLRLTRFTDDDGTVTYHGTYTAFDGMHARSELLTGTDFRSFEMRALSGDAASAKGMALFPRRIGGRYAMLGRQDSENIWLHLSDDLLSWEGGAPLIGPTYPWETIQMGNCGPPIEIDEGWLVLTHGVGTVRNYSIGAALLERDDPSRVLARTPDPILMPEAGERDGYVPNVVYSCGGMVHEGMLLLPYGAADSVTAFASVAVDELVAAMR